MADRYEWLVDDGIIDDGAIDIVVRGDRPNKPPKLTELEAKLATMKLVASGFTQRQIAERIGISERTANKWATAARKGELIKT